jgi:hypothetical protein
MEHRNEKTNANRTKVINRSTAADSAWENSLIAGPSQALRWIWRLQELPAPPDEQWRM